MLNEIETVNRGYPVKRDLIHGRVDWDLIRECEELIEDEGIVVMLKLTMNDVMNHCPYLDEQQAMEVLYKMKKKWEIDWQDAVDVWAYGMFSKLERAYREKGDD